MRFEQWVLDSKRPRAQVAADLGCDQSTVAKIILGTRWPSRRIANSIERITNGLIRSTDWDDAEDDAEDAAERARTATGTDGPA